MPEFSTTGLLDYQVPHALRLANGICSPGRFPFSIDCSDTGTGKTYSACSLVRHFDAPTLVVCPVAIQRSWERVGRQLGGEVTTVGYERLRMGNSPYGTWSTLKRGSTGMRYFRFAPEIKFLVLDEVHRCRGTDTLNHQLAIGAKLCGIPTLAMSATPAESPMDMRAIGYLMGWFDYYHFWSWVQAHNCVKDFQRRWRFVDGARRSKTAVMDDLKTKMLQFGGRMRISDIPGFPQNRVVAELYETGAGDRIQTLYESMRPELEALARRREDDFNPDHGLTKILRQREEIELLKVQTFCSLTRDEIDQGRSVVCFVNFRRTIEALCGRLEGFNPAVIHGDTEDVDAEMERFQQNRTFLAICQSDTGGIGLGFHDLFGRPRTSLISPHWSAIVFRQILGRICRAGGLSACLQRVLLASGTIEERVFQVFFAKNSCIAHLLGDAVTDDDLNPYLVGTL